MEKLQGKINASVIRHLLKLCVNLIKHVKYDLYTSYIILNFIFINVKLILSGNEIYFINFNSINVIILCNLKQFTNNSDKS